MFCPRCRTTTGRRTHHDIEVDVCEACGGVFLDRGELNRIAEPTSGDLEYSTIHDEDFRHPDDFPPIPCPRCGTESMGKVEFNVHTGIILDFCDQCGGFWLDGAELERINREIRELNEAGGETKASAIQWFAQFLFGLPR